MVRWQFAEMRWKGNVQGLTASITTQWSALQLVPHHQRLQDKTYDGYGEAEKFWRAAIFGTVKNDVTGHVLPKILQF